MRYGSELNCDEFLNEFEKCIALQNKFYDRPCDKRDLNLAKCKISTFFGKDREDDYRDKIQILCNLSGYNFSRIYRKRHFPKEL
jgi:hypothetical protein